MLDNISRVSAKGKRLVKKVIEHRNDLPQKIKQKSKNKLRPIVHKTRIIKRKAVYATKLASSSKERQLYKLLKPARIHYGARNWEGSIAAFQPIVDNFDEDTPTEVFLKLSRSYREVGEFARADDLLVRASQLISRGVKGDFATQDTLQEWLSISDERGNLSAVERTRKIEEYNEQIAKYIKDKAKRPERQKKIAVVSAISGGYDSVKFPAVIDSRLDYVIYSDTPVENPGFYDVRPLPYFDADKTRSARFVKTNIQNLLPDYDYVVWVDANVMIVGDIYKSIVEPVIKSKKTMGAMLHPVRSSPFEEMNACIKAGKDDVNAIIEQKKFYEDQGFESDRLIESNILVYNIGDRNLAPFLSEWWNQIDRFSRRDQLSFNYALDKAGADWMTFTDRPDTSRNHKDVALMNHGGKSEPLLSLSKALDVQVEDPLVRPKYLSHKKQDLKTVANKKITAVVCVHNAHDDVKMCLESVKKHKAINQDLLIIDDGSEDLTKDYLEEFVQENKEWVQLRRHDKAKGYTVAASRGLKESKADFTILLNSDTIVTKDWANKMASVAFNNPGVGIVGPMSSAASTQSLPDYKSTKDQTAINSLPAGVSVDDMNDFCEKWSSLDSMPRVPLVHGFSFGVRREVIEKIGLLDAKSFPRGYGEENDYCFRAADAGFGLAIATNTYIFHTKSKSFVSSERAKLMQDGARAFRDKHGQRRITRAVETMQQNVTLQMMRNEAERLYIKQQLMVEGKYDGEHYVPVGPELLHELSHENLVKKLTGLNNSLNWSMKRKASKLKASIVVLVLNNPKMSTRCVESIMKSDNSVDKELIVVNNGSTIETFHALRDLKKKYPAIKLVHIEQNVNFSLGNNIGSTYAEGEYVILLNNDTYVTNGWLDELVKPLVERKDIKAAQPLLLYPGGDIQNMGIVFSSKSSLGYGLYVGESGRDKRIVYDRDTQAVTGACIAMRLSDYRQVQGLDPSYVNGQEDVDLCLRLTKDTADTTCYVATKSVVYHDESRTPGRSRKNLPNRKEFLRRWSGKTIADDEAIYEKDGLVTTRYRNDTTENRVYETAVYVPTLKRK